MHFCGEMSSWFFIAHTHQGAGAWINPTIAGTKSCGETNASLATPTTLLFEDPICFIIKGAQNVPQTQG